MIEQELHLTRLKGQNSRRILLVVAGVFALTVTGAFGLIVRAQLPTASTTIIATPKTERVVIAIEGMHCGGCASGVKAMLKRTPGVVSSDVSFEQKEAKVEFDSSATSREKIVEAINNIGYKASLKG
ncbi:MAG: heavy-metal-associated domain-containing protein [Pyrinomonadaceae bacterium]|nr:heavy-metal-associated domain-containing protein [Pyrinomonadaceae bacterium]